MSMLKSVFIMWFDTYVFMHSLQVYVGQQPSGVEFIAGVKPRGQLTVVMTHWFGSHSAMEKKNQYA